MSRLWIMDETDSQAQDQTKELDPEGLLDQQDEEEEDGDNGDSSHISEKMCEQALASATEASGSDYESEGTDTEMDQEEGEPTGALPAGKVIFGSGTGQNIPGENPDGSAPTGSDGDAFPAEQQTNSAMAAASAAAAAIAAAAAAVEPAKKSELVTSISTGKKRLNPAEIVQRFKVPAMVPKPMTDSGLKKKVEEPDVIPTDSYRKIRESLPAVSPMKVWAAFTIQAIIGLQGLSSRKTPMLSSQLQKALIQTTGTALLALSNTLFWGVGRGGREGRPGRSS